MRHSSISRLQKLCLQKLVDKLEEECTRIINEDKIYNETLTMTSSNDCASCTTYVVLFAVFLSMSVIICGAFVYFYWYKNKQLDFKKNVPDVKYSGTETLIY